jgi:hypothetical protein
MLIIFIILIICILVVLINAKSKISSLSKNKHDVTPILRDIEKIQDVPIKRVGVYKTDNQNGSWAHDFRKSSIREILSTSDTNARLQYKTDMVDDKHPLCKVIKRRFRGVGYTLRVCSGNWEFKSHFDCDDNRIMGIYGSKRFLVFDMFDHPSELDILEHTKNMPIDILKPFLEKRKIKVQEHYLQPGDELYIKAGMYHRVEARESSIILGHAPPQKYTCRCQKKFSEIWPKQGKICENNRCLE